MTEPLDLDALKRECATAAHVCNRTTSVLELIAELEATRAERDEYHDSDLRTTTLLFKERARAERAQAELAAAVERIAELASLARPAITPYTGEYVEETYE